MILAGGRASRMGGGDKSLLPLGDRTVLSHVVDRLRPQVAEIVINANGPPERFATYEVPVVADPLEERPGPLAGVLAGMRFAVERGHPGIITVAADTPFFPADLVPRLLDAAAAARAPIALAATVDGAGESGRVLRHPTFGFWSTALADDLEAALASGIRKIVQWTDGHGAATALFPSEGFDPFFNINTPEDLATGEAILAAAATAGAGL